MSTIKITKKFKSIFGSSLFLGLVALLLTSCENGTSSNKSVLLKGAGASFPAPLYQKWIQQYNENQENIEIDYESVGSGMGIQNFMAENVDFGATDAPLTSEDIARYPSNRGQVIQIPMTGGLLVLAYNLSNYEGAQDIRLSRQTYCGIIEGKITNWNDSAIVADNPEARLPDLPIVFVHRNDSSGSTFLFTSHLQAVCDNWQLGAAKKVEWATGLGGDGNQGVSTLIQQTQGTIGYIEYSEAKNKSLKVASLENKAGNFVKPTPENASEAFAIDTIPEDMAIVLPDPEANNGYPIVGLTWLLIYGKYDSEPDKAKAMQDFVKWSLTKGDNVASELGYFPLPNRLKTKVITKLEQNFIQ